MEMAEITKVEDLTNADQVNAYLDLGWKILGYYTTVADEFGPYSRHLTPHFVMVWVGAEPQYPPKPVSQYRGLEL